MILNNHKESIYDGDFEVDYSMVKDGKFRNIDKRNFKLIG